MPLLRSQPLLKQLFDGLHQKACSSELPSPNPDRGAGACLQAGPSGKDAISYRDTRTSNALCWHVGIKNPIPGFKRLQITVCGMFSRELG